VFANDPNRATAVLECLASESYRTVTPEIFEITIKVKYSSEENSAKIYDIIRNGAVYDLIRVFYKSFTNPIDTLYQNSIINNNTNWKSTIDGYVTTYNNEIVLIQSALNDKLSK